MADQFQERLFYFEGGKLVKIEETTEKQGHAGFSFVRVSLILLHEIDFSFENFLVDFKGELMDNVDFRIKTLR